MPRCKKILDQYRTLDDGIQQLPDAATQSLERRNVYGILNLGIDEGRRHNYEAPTSLKEAELNPIDRTYLLGFDYG